MGPSGSAVWSSLLDGAEELLRDEGYAALTSRRIAERVGVKQQLVYYYFRTMEDLVVETFRRLAAREIDRLAAALASEKPLRDIWEICIHTSDGRLISEFTALAHRSEGVREQVVSFIEKSRKMQVDALSKVLKEKGAQALPLPVMAIALLATSAALTLTRESEIGVSLGHAETLRTVLEFIEHAEPMIGATSKSAAVGKAKRAPAASAKKR